MSALPVLEHEGSGQTQNSSFDRRSVPASSTSRRTRKTRLTTGLSFVADVTSYYGHGDVDLPDFALLHEESLGMQSPGMPGGSVDCSVVEPTKKSRIGITFFKSELNRLADEGGGADTASMSSYVRPALMLSTFVVTSCADPVMKAASKGRKDINVAREYSYEPASVILAASLISVALGNIMSWCHIGFQRGLRRCWDPRMLGRCFIPAGLFNIAQILKFIGLMYLPVDVAVLLDQMSLVVLAVMMRIVLKKYYSSPQWCSLIVTSTSMLQYMILREAHGSSKDAKTDMSHNFHIGFAVMLLQVLVSVLAAVLTEKLLKAAPVDGEEPLSFWEQKAQLEFGGSVITLVWCYTAAGMISGNDQVVKEGVFSGWNAWTVACMMTLLLKLWLAGIIAKVLDSVVKQLGSCCAMLLTFFIQLSLPAPLGKAGIMEFHVDVGVALLTVALSVSSFALSTRQTQQLSTKDATIKNIVQLAHIRTS